MSNRECKQITSIHGKVLLIKFTRVDLGIWEASIDNYEGTRKFYTDTYIPARRAFNRLMRWGRQGRFDNVSA